MNTNFAPNETKHWLVVDDDAEVLLLLAKTIKNLTRAEIECHPSPRAALAAFAAAPAKYELVITDFEMPEMDGVAFCHRLHELVPAQKVFLATGSGFFTAATARHAGFSALLNKPFPLAALHKALAAVGLEKSTAATG
jgi:CheY-like chemotaxis protein